MTAVLQLNDVTRVHGEGETAVQALRGVSLAAHAGELVAIMGPSGSGKSTLLTLAGGLDTPTSGTVSVEGTDLATLGTYVVLSGRTTLVLSGTRTTTAFGENETFLGSDLAAALNRYSDTEQLELRYRLTPLTTLVVASDAVQDRFATDRLRNTDSIAVRPGFEFKPFALISGKVSVGFRHFNVLNDRVQDYQGPVANVDASYTLTTSTQIHGTMTRDVAFSYDENFPYYALTNAGVTITQRIASAWDVVARGGWQTVGYRTLTTGVDGVPLDERGKMYGLGVGYRLGESFRIGFDANYYRRRSQTSTRNYDGLRAGMSLTYGISQ